MSGNSNSGGGGARRGAGRKKKPISEKILEGNPGKRKLTVLQFPEPIQMSDMPTPKEYLSATQKDGKDLIAKKIYEDTWQWLEDRGCAGMVNPSLIEQYSIAAARGIQCEEAITTYGFIIKHPTTAMPMQSPYISIALNYQKQANSLWSQMYQTVKENCTTEYAGDKSSDPMERLLSIRGL